MGEAFIEECSIKGETVRRWIGEDRDGIYFALHEGGYSYYSPFTEYHYIEKDSPLPPFKPLPANYEDWLLGGLSKYHGQKILNVGAGKSTLGIRGQACGVTVINIDPKYSEGEIDHGSLLAVKAVGEMLPFTDSSVDAVFISQLLCLLDDSAPVLTESMRVLKLGGKLIVYPVVAYRCLTAKHIPDCFRFKRVGIDSFCVSILKGDNHAEALTLLNNPDYLALKGSKGFFKKRQEGYYFHEVEDKLATEWWLGNWE